MLDSHKPGARAAGLHEGDSDGLTEIVDGLIERLDLRASADRTPCLPPRQDGKSQGQPHSAGDLARAGDHGTASRHPATVVGSELIGRQDELAVVSTMKRGAYLINTARAQICNRDAIVRAIERGHLAGCAGDVWYLQPAPFDHPWRSMPHQGITPHVSGTSLSNRYAAGTREILECWFENRPIRDEYLIVDAGQLAGTGAVCPTPSDPRNPN